MQSILLRVIAGLAMLGMAGCAGLNSLPKPITTQERLNMIPTAGLPVQRPVTIYWSKEQIPFIEAETDHDAAMALGLVHAHLRLGQLETLRRISQGRLTEIAGPIGRIREIDRALRIIDLGKSSRQVYARMPQQNRDFLNAFVEGLNYYQQHVAELPSEYALLGIDREPWRPDEILTLGRLASIDVSWLVWLRLMPLRERPDWPQLWAQALARGTGAEPTASPKQTAGLQDLTNLLGGTARVGSNSFAVGGSRTRSGAAIIASDPHLGLGLPAMWLLAGLKSPSYHTVGFMIPGLPFVAEGRNEDIAWGGTNLRSAASDVIDVSGIPQDQIKARNVERSVRWWFEDTQTIRDTPYGPIISDSELIPKRPGEEFALKWIGHLPSDEVSAMLGVNKARNWDEFSKDLDGFSISAQNFVYADTKGNVGQLIATHLPQRSLDPPKDIVQPLSEASAWNTILSARDLPQAYNPPEGFVASANNKPPDTSVPVGYFFGGEDRVVRFRELLSAAKNVTVDDIKMLQRDTYMLSAMRLRDAILRRSNEIEDMSPDAQETLDIIRSWDGRYDTSSRGAVAFQAMLANLVPKLADPVELEVIESGSSEDLAYAALIEEAPLSVMATELQSALAAAKPAIAAYPTWGDMHALELRHAFSAIPVIGSKFRFGEVPWPGSTETIWRASHGLSSGKVTTGFGSEARHISDLSDMDSNWFALVGGNDGWINSANFLDQVEPFRTSDLIQVPMRLETVRAKFPYRTTLAPPAP
jgi:penicillin amidase